MATGPGHVLSLIQAEGMEFEASRKLWSLYAPNMKTQEAPLTSDLFSMVQFALGAPFHGQPAFPSLFPSSLVSLTCDHPGQEKQALPKPDNRVT